MLTKFFEEMRRHSILSRVLLMISVVVVISTVISLAVIKFNTTTPTVRTGFWDLSLGDQSRAEVDQLIKKSELITGALVMDLDFSKNRKKLVYVRTDSQSFDGLAGGFSAAQLSSIPIFTASDSLNNHMMARLINGEFYCYSLVDTYIYLIFPSLKESSTWACSTAIPPYYGNFHGYLTLFLKNEPHDERLESLRVDARELSLGIYNRDVR